MTHTHLSDIASREFRTIFIGTCLLSFNAGFANVLGILSTFSSTVSHQSGNVSRLGVALANPSESYDQVCFFTTVILSFGLGAFLAGFMVGDSKFVLGRAYWSAILIESAAFFAAFFWLRSGHRYGEYAASFACGVQNSLTSNYAGAVVRTTHLTGTITDVFSILGVHVAKNFQNPEIWKLQFYLPSIIFFTMGATSATYVFHKISYYACFVPAFLTLIIALTYVSIPAYHEARKALKTVSGKVRYLTLQLHDKHGNTIVPNLSNERENAVLDSDIANLLSDIERYLGSSRSINGSQTLNYNPPATVNNNISDSQCPNCNSEQRNDSVNGSYILSSPDTKRNLSNNLEVNDGLNDMNGISQSSSPQISIRWPTNITDRRVSSISAANSYNNSPYLSTNRVHSNYISQEFNDDNINERTNLLSSNINLDSPFVNNSNLLSLKINKNVYQRSRHESDGSITPSRLTPNRIFFGPDKTLHIFLNDDDDDTEGDDINRSDTNSKL